MLGEPPAHLLSILPQLEDSRGVMAATLATHEMGSDGTILEVQPVPWPSRGKSGIGACMCQQGRPYGLTAKGKGKGKGEAPQDGEDRSSTSASTGASTNTNTHASTHTNTNAIATASANPSANALAIAGTEWTGLDWNERK
jgi:hypothetical protein